MLCVVPPCKLTQADRPDGCTGRLASQTPRISDT
jgi:hypothetical protein